MTKHELSSGLSALGSDTVYQYGGAEASLLESFPVPPKFESGPAAGMGRMTGMVLIVAPEFTSLCPKTGQPDFATIVVEYLPRRLCVESKSFKLYLGSFRNHRGFHEECVGQIALDLFRLLDPYWIVVQGRFTPRGGIPFWPLVQIHGLDFYEWSVDRVESMSRVFRGDLPSER